MKYYKIKLPMGPKGYIYPPNYENNIGKLNKGHLYYDDEDDGMFTLLLMLSDEDALEPLPDNVSEVTEAAVTTITNKYEPKAMIITNEAVVRNLEIKSKAGTTLTKKELDALDPNNPEPGFGMSENLVDKINKYKK